MNFTKVILDLFGDGEFLPNDQLMKFLAKEVCPSDLDVVCANVLFLICGFDEKNTNDVSVLLYTCIAVGDILLYSLVGVILTPSPITQPLTFFQST